MLELLRDHGARFTDTDKNDMTPLHWASLSGYSTYCLPVILTILNLKEINKPCPYMDTQSGLRMACYSGHLECVQQLIEASADIDYVDSVLGETALHMACQFNHPLVVRHLMENGAEVNITNKEGKWNAAHYAASCGHSDCLQALIQYTTGSERLTFSTKTTLTFADSSPLRFLSARTKMGHTPLDLTQDSNRDQRPTEV